MPLPELISTDAFRPASRAGVVNWNRRTNGAASNAPAGGIATARRAVEQ